MSQRSRQPYPSRSDPHNAAPPRRADRARGDVQPYPDVNAPAGANEQRGRAPARLAWRGRSVPLMLVVAGGVIGAVILLLVVGTIGAGVVRVAARDHIYDNVYVSGQNLGGLTRGEARTRLVTVLSPMLDAPVTLTYGGRQWTPKRADLGIAVDYDATVAEAYAVGRAEGPIGQIIHVWEIRGGRKTTIPLSVGVDQATTDGYLDRLHAEIGTPPVDATVSVKSNAVIVTPGADGVRLDRESVQRLVIEDLAHLQQTTLALSVTYAVPAVTTDAANAAKVKIDELVAAPLVLTFGDKQWELGHDLLLSGVRVGPGPEFAAKFDPAAFRGRVAQIGGELKQEPQNAVIGWDGALVVRKPAKNGQRLNVDETLARIGAWQGGGDRALALPVEVAPPRITDDLGKLGITKRVAQGVSNFAGSDAARAKNIAVAAGYLDDTVVGPGETFSFLDAIGEISAERGYQKGYVILAEETVPGIGGGVCQVATTMFRAAVYSGLPIAERNPHAYLVRYYEQGGYPVGLDAAVFSPGVDMKFQNESNAYLLIKTAIDGAGNLYISMYGPDLGYEVDLSKPTISNKKDAPEDEYQIDPMLPAGTKKQVEYAKAGEDVSITRVVKKNGAVVREVRFFTRYQAWANKYLVSKDMAPNAKGTEATRAANNPTAGLGTKTATGTGAAGTPGTTTPANMPTRVPTMPTVVAIPTTKPALATPVPTAAATKASVAATPVPTKKPG